MSHYMTFKLQLNPNKQAEDILYKNCVYRNWVYNKMVEMIKKRDSHKLQIDFSLLKEFRNKYEKTADNRPDWLEDYSFYITKLSAGVYSDISTICHTIITKRKSKLPSNLRFIKFNPNHLSFSIENPIIRKEEYSPTGSKIVITDNPYIIGLKINKNMGILGLNLNESINNILNNPLFDINEIRKISVVYHNDKWHLYLSIKCDEGYTILKDNRIKVAGIDLGEINPVVIYDGKIVRIPKQLAYPKDAIARVNRHIDNCKRVMDRKFRKDLKDAGLSQSKNYYKVLRKFHKYHEKRKNILKDWHFKLAHWIVTHYRNIVVDEFKDHIVEKWKEYPTQLRQRCNHSMYNKSMYIFTERLIHMCIKYGTNYFKSKFETTNTCSICGNVNNNKLEITNRTFKCECCDNIMDRDINASINCYNAFKNKKCREVFLELI